MNWDQIERKWAEMTSRVRGDVAKPLARNKAGAAPDAPSAIPGEGPAEAAAPVIRR